MIYCRYAQDMEASDVYAYKCERGYVVCVANNRFAPRGPGTDVDKLIPIGLSRDGKDYVFAHSSECADCLQSLKAEGYHVPQYAIDELLEEAAEAPGREK